MRLRRSFLAWFLVFALAFMNFPVMADELSGVINLEVGQRIEANGGDTIEWGWDLVSCNYYTTSSALQISCQECTWGSYSVKKVTDLHMAPVADDSGSQWYVERQEDRANVNSYTSSPPDMQYAIYPTQTYYAAEYDLGGGSWNTLDHWIEEKESVAHGIWKPAITLENYIGNLWYVYKGYSVTLPTAAEVTREDYELSGWEIGTEILSLGNIYSLKDEDATVEGGQPTIKIKAIWKNKNISNPVISDITKTSAKISVTYNVEDKITAMGIKIAEAETEEWTDLEMTVSDNQITAAVDNLSKNTSYKVQASLATATGEITTEEIAFQTLKDFEVRQVQVGDVTTQGASLTASYLSDDALTTQGFKYKKTSETADEWQQVEATVNASSVMASLDNLSPNTEYSVKAYIKTSEGTIESEAVTFTTNKRPQSVEKVQVSDITKNTASFTTSYVSDDNIMAQGFKYRKTSETNGEWQEVEGAISGSSITASLDNLSPNTEYSVKGYLTTNVGTTESETVTFTTSKRPQSVEKAQVSDITKNTASFTTSYVSDDGIIAQGFKYRKTSETTGEWQEVEGTISGSSITASLNTLSPNTEYSVKGYITTNAGTTESEAVTFTTSKRIESIEKAQVTDITKSTASFTTSYVSDDDIIAQGFKYKKSAASEWIEIQAPNINIDEMKFSINVTGLSTNTTYEVKAYLETAKGQTESEVITFITKTSSSSSSTNTSDSSSSSSSSNTTDSPKTEPTPIIPETGGPLVILVNSSDSTESDSEVTVPIESINNLIESEQKLIIQSKNISITVNPSTLKEMRLMNPRAANLTLSVPLIDAVKLEDIKTKVSQEKKIVMVGGSKEMLSINFGRTQTNITTKRDANAVLNEPLTIAIDLSKIEFKDSKKLTIVKYEQKQEGHYSVKKLGGTYDKETGKFSAYITEQGMYGVIEAADLTKVNLQIGNFTSTVNEISMTNDIAPQIVQSTTFVPLRFIAESMGAEVKWDNKNKKVRITLEGQTVEVDSKQGMVIQESRTLVPIRYVVEHLGANVLWIPSTQSIEIVR